MVKNNVLHSAIKSHKHQLLKKLKFTRTDDFSLN